MNLPAELSQMQNTFNELVASVQAGHVSNDDAVATLAGLSATDGSGAVWGMTPEGQFTRAHNSSASGVVSEPTSWAESGGNLTTPPSGYNSPGSSLFAPPVNEPTQFRPMGMQEDSFNSGFESPKSLSNPDEEPKKGKKSKERKEKQVKSSNSSDSPGALAGVVAWVNEHKKAAILGAFGVALLGFSVTQLIPSDEPTQALPGIEQTSPDVEVDLLGGDEDVALPLDNDGDSSEQGELVVEAPGSGSKPTDSDVQALLSSLSAGDSQGMILSGNSNDIARASVVIAGVEGNPNLLVQTTRVKKAKNGKATQTIVIENTVTGDDIFTAKVTWVKDDGVWKIQKAPLFK